MKRQGDFISFLFPSLPQLSRPLENGAVWDLLVYCLPLPSSVKCLDVRVLRQRLLCLCQCTPSAFPLERVNDFFFSRSFSWNSVSSLPTFSSHSLVTFHCFSATCLDLCDSDEVVVLYISHHACKVAKVISSFQSSGF